MPQAETAAALARSGGIFKGFSTDDCLTVGGYLTVRRLEGGSDLWAVGDQGDYLACILAGRIEIKVDTEFPGKQLVVGVFTAGTVIGASCLLDHLPRDTAAKALESSTLALLDRKRFTTLTTDHPQLAIRLLKGALLAESSRLRQAYARLASVF